MGDSRCSALGSECFSVFVDGLLRRVSKQWLQQIFGQFGELVDIFILCKVRRSTFLPFAFVGYRKLEEAAKAIHELNNTKVEGHRVVVAKAHPRYLGIGRVRLRCQRHKKRTVAI